jgi:signal peptidase I
MDLVLIATIALVISLPLVIWDVVTSLSSRGSAYIQPYMQVAYLALFVAGFYLLVSKNILNFSAVLLIATVLTGAIWIWDIVARRKEAVARSSAADGGVKKREESAERANNSAAASAKPAEEPTWLELAKSFFPVILVVFMIRSFLVEPFKIPSGSMIPTLLVGDFILVNKFTYGIRLPVINKKIIEVNQPQRGEVMVFRYPKDPALDYIKRVVGVPGDRVTYRNKRLEINGEPLAIEPAGEYAELENGLGIQSSERYREKLGRAQHDIIINPAAPPAVDMSHSPLSFPHRENCAYADDGFTCTVPPGHYFMLGDNRDNSRDSRYWGFVPEENIVGKAFLIWANFSELKRIFTLIR